MFITIYGVNNIGKSTHSKMLVKNLRKMGHEAVYIKYPIYDMGPTGPHLDRVLRQHNQDMTEEQLQLWFVLNRHQYQDTLRAYLNKDIIVVAEDYIGTGLAWGAAKGADMDWLKEMNRFLIEEDLAILMNGPRAKHSIEEGHIHENDNELVSKVRKNLLMLADENGWERVETQAEKKDTQKLILDIVKERLN